MPIISPSGRSQTRQNSDWTLYPYNGRTPSHHPVGWTRCKLLTLTLVLCIQNEGYSDYQSEIVEFLQLWSLRAHIHPCRVQLHPHPHNENQMWTILHYLSQYKLRNSCIYEPLQKFLSHMKLFILLESSGDIGRHPPVSLLVGCSTCNNAWFATSGSPHPHPWDLIGVFRWFFIQHIMHARKWHPSTQLLVLVFISFAIRAS